MDTKEIYHKIGQSIFDSIETSWDSAVLEIKYTGKSGGFHLNYFYNDEEFNAEYSGDYNMYKTIKELHKTTTEEGIYTKWNRIVFKLTPDGQMELEYIWDQELYDEIERLSK